MRAVDYCASGFELIQHVVAAEKRMHLFSLTDLAGEKTGPSGRRIKI